MGILMGIFQGIKDAIVSTIKSIITNTEAVIILTFSAIGITAFISELPFTTTIPLWIETAITTPMLLPVFSVLLVTGLILIMTWRLRLEGVEC